MVFCSSCGRAVQGPALVDGAAVRHANCGDRTLDEPALIGGLKPGGVIPPAMPIVAAPGDEILPLSRHRAA